MQSSTFLERVRAEPYQTASLCVFLVSAYLCLVNLNYAALWYDEAAVALLGKNLLEQGDIVGWDGRNLVGGPKGRTLNEELRDVAPPLQFVLTAAGFAVLGFNDTGARIIHALAGILALGVFYLILHQHLSDSPRLTFFIFLFAAWSAQFLMWVRQARYYSVTVLCMMAGLYLYIGTAGLDRGLRGLALLRAGAAVAAGDEGTVCRMGMPLFETRGWSNRGGSVVDQRGDVPFSPHHPAFLGAKRRIHSLPVYR